MFYNLFNNFLFFNYILNLSYNDYNTCFCCNKNINSNLSLRSWRIYNINIYGKLCLNCNHKYINSIFNRKNNLSKNLYPKFFYDKSFIFIDFIYYHFEDDIDDYQFHILGNPFHIFYDNIDNIDNNNLSDEYILNN